MQQGKIAQLKEGQVLKVGKLRPSIDDLLKQNNLHSEKIYKKAIYKDNTDNFFPNHFSHTEEAMLTLLAMNHTDEAIKKKLKFIRQYKLEWIVKVQVGNVDYEAKVWKEINMAGRKNGEGDKASKKAERNYGANKINMSKLFKKLDNKAPLPK